MLKKLQMKFVLVNMTIVILMLIVIFGLVYGFTQRNLATESVSMMNAIATKPLQPGPPNDTAPEVKLPFIILHLGFDGELVLAEGAFYDLSDSEFLNELIDASMQNKNDIGVIKEHNLRFCRVKNPRGTVLVFSDISSERSTLNHLLQSFGMIGCISSLVFLGISILLAKWAVKPVAKAWQQQKQFVADASHELKTPLTVIMTNTELLQSTDYNELERKKFLQSISLMSGQMKQLVEKMLSEGIQSRCPTFRIRANKYFSEILSGRSGKKSRWQLWTWPIHSREHCIYPQRKNMGRKSQWYQFLFCRIAKKDILTEKIPSLQSKWELKAMQFQKLFIG